jgi:glycosyltransferase involved in cell wall biosynthesis
MTRPPLLVVHPGAELYGADRMLLESAMALTGSFTVTVALPGPGPLAAELQAQGVRVEICPMPVLRNSALRPHGALRLLADAVRGLLPAWRLLRRNPAGVYVSTLTLPSWPLLARLARRRSICHVHEAEQSAPRPLRLGMALCPALADRIVANSRFTLDVLTEVAPRLRSRATVVHNAVRGPAAGPVAARERLDGPVRLLFVGRLNPRKGPQVALAALRELGDRGVDARLTVIGDVFAGYEWFADELHATVADAGLGDRVEFLGFRADVWPHLAGADVVLVPAIGDESFGNTAVEAVLAARPLVVSDHSGLREAAAGYDSAQAVPAGDPGSWADAVTRVVADWPRFREAAAADAAAARRRSAPERYAAELVDAVLALGATVPASPGLPAPRELPAPPAEPVAGSGAAA